MDSRTFVVVENIRQADGVYVALYLLACQVEFM